MDSRTRLIGMAQGLTIDRAPWFCHFGPWAETLERWHAEDLGPDRDWWEPFHFDAGFRTLYDVNLGYLPSFPYETIKDEGRTLIIRDQFGITQRIRKDSATIPQYLNYPVYDRESWLRLRERLNPDDPARFPKDWGGKAKGYNEGDAANMIGCYPYGLFGTLRDMFGVETLLTEFYDAPELIHEIMDYLTDFWIAIWEKTARDVRLDAIHMWEDMSGVSGPLISPAMVREFMCPNYEKMTDFCIRHDIHLFTLDTDGDVTMLIKPFMDAGINLMFPFEVQAGCDVNAYLLLYPKLICMGGIDKRALAISRQAIDIELDRVVPAIKTGRYIPQLDHLPHPEIPWDNFVYFYMRLKEVIESSQIG